MKQAVLRSSLQLRDYEHRQCEAIWNDVDALIEKMCLDEDGSLKPAVLGWHLEVLYCAHLAITQPVSLVPVSLVITE